MSQITNNYDLPDEFVELAKLQRDVIPKSYSVTTIMKSVREIMLLRRHDDEIIQDVSDMAWLLFGTAMHHIVELAPLKKYARKANIQKERKLSLDVGDGYTLFGTYDHLDIRKKRLSDWKTCSVFKVIKRDFNQDKLQTYIYSHMEKELTGKEIESTRVVYLMKDWHVSDSWKIKNYPARPIHIQDHEFLDSDNDSIALYIKERFHDIKQHENTPDEDLPKCKDTWGGNKCLNYCAVNAFCKYGISALKKRGSKEDVVYLSKSKKKTVTNEEIWKELELAFKDASNK